MKEKIKNILNSIIELLVTMFNGIKNQMGTAKGALLFLVLIAFAVDVVMVGKLGIIRFSIDQLKVVAGMLKSIPVAIVVGLLIIFWKK